MKVYTTNTFLKFNFFSIKYKNVVQKLHIIPYLIDGGGGEGVEGVVHILHQEAGLDPGNVAVVVVDDVQRGVAGIPKPAQVNYNIRFGGTNYLAF